MSTRKESAFQINHSYNNTLDVDSFVLMLKSPSYCYKFYWLEALVRLISEGKSETTFDEIINEMICNAWYSVREFHIHLSGLQEDGQVRDGLEHVIKKNIRPVYDSRRQQEFEIWKMLV